MEERDDCQADTCLALSRENCQAVTRICFGRTASLKESAFFPLPMAFPTSSSEAPFLISKVSSVGSMCLTFVLLRRTPEIFGGPVTSTKFLSITSTMTHFCPVSRPLSFTQTRPTSIMGIGTIFLDDPRGRNPHLRFRRFSLGFPGSSYHHCCRDKNLGCILDRSEACIENKMVDGAIFDLKSIMSGVSFPLNRFSLLGLHASLFNGDFVPLSNSFQPDLLGSRKIDS